jgi:hypothetical protein
MKKSSFLMCRFTGASGIAKNIRVKEVWHRFIWNDRESRIRYHDHIPFEKIRWREFFFTEKWSVVGRSEGIRSPFAS